MTSNDNTVTPSNQAAGLSSQQFNVVRRLYRQDSLNIDAGYQTPTRTLTQGCKKLARKCGFESCLLNAVPIVQWLPKYKIKKYLWKDLIAGILLGLLHIPHGIAFSLLGSCQPTVGMYMAIYPVIVYVIFGNSPHISLGTFAMAMLLTGKVIQEHSKITEENVHTYTTEEVVCTLTFAVGLIQICMWCLRLGAISTLLSEPLVSGLWTGASCHVFTSQLKDVLGIKLAGLPNNFRVIRTVWGLFKHITETNVFGVFLAFITSAILFIYRYKIKPRLLKRCRVPIELILIMIATLMSMLLDLKKNMHVEVVGYMPRGLPAPTLPRWDLFRFILLEAVTVTIVTYTLTISIAFIIADTERYEIDPNQELLALGASNLFGCFFMCAPVCAGLSRSHLQHTMGCKTLIASLVGAVTVIFMLFTVSPYFEALPRCVLAAIVLATIKHFHCLGLKKFWRLSKLDAIVWMVTFLFTVIVYIDIGTYAGLLANIGTLFFRAQSPYSCLLGRVLDTNLYLDINRYRAAHEIPRLKIFHYCGGLNFASKNTFRDRLFRKTGYLRLIDEADADATADYTLANATSYVWDPAFSQKIACIIIDASALSYVDAPGIKILVEVNDALRSSGITTLLAGANGPVLEMIEKFNSLEKERLLLRIFPTVHDAVTHYLNKQKKTDLIVMPEHSTLIDQ